MAEAIEFTPAQPSGRCAWVTGAARGIGSVIAEHLALQLGHRVVLLDRDHAALDDTCQRLRGLGADAHVTVIDLADRTALRPALRALSATMPADVLVNNAGVAMMRSALDFPEADWDLTLAVNLTAPMLLTQHCLAHMRAAGWGRVVNIASISGLRAGEGRLAYGTSKAALIALTQQFAVEAARWGITVNAVAPGMVQSEMAGRLIDPAQLESMLGRIPQHRYSSAHDTAAAVAFLVSDQASYITGHTLPVDGGFCIAGWLQPTAA